MLAWLGCGLLLIALMWGVVWVTREVHSPHPRVAAWWATLLSLVAAGVYFAAILLRPHGSTRRILVLALVLGAGMRAPMWLMPEADGADYWRYMWDGAVTTRGMNPYRHAPGDALDEDPARTRIGKLAAANRNVIEKINHPHLRTIYPPVAQGLFAVAHWLAPFRPLGLRIVLLACEALGVFALVRIGRHMNLPAAYLTVAVWNPLLISETYGGCHVDIAVAVAILLVAWCLLRGRVVLAAVALAIATGLKLYPLLLVFFLIGAAWRRWRVLAASMGLLAAMLALLAVPQALTWGRAHGGLTPYLSQWQANAGAHRLIHYFVVGRFDEPGWPLAALLSRVICVVAALAFAAWKGCTSLRRGKLPCADMASAILVMLLLNPTVHPWYYVALVPLAAGAPRASLLAWTALLGLTYLPCDEKAWMMWLVHLPVWCLLATEWVTGLRNREPRIERNV